MAIRPAELVDVFAGRRRSRLRLLAPLRYLSIRHPDKSKYDIMLPLVTGLVFAAVLLFVAPGVRIFGDAGVLKYTRDLLVMAVPFEIGALATVAMASAGPGLDRRPQGAELILDNEILTLRQFVCRLLGYLTFLSLITLCGAVAADLFKTTVVSWTICSPVLHSFVRSAGVIAISLLLSSLLVTVLWALYFLADVVAQPQPPERR